MLAAISADVQRALRRNNAFGLIGVLRVLRSNHGLQALATYRFGRWLSRLDRHRIGVLVTAPLHPIYRFAAFLTRKTYGIELDPDADIGPGLFIGHFGGISVKSCRIGPHCAIQQQVTLGPAQTGGAGPVLGEGVWVGAHARICADVSIGDGATIGAGAVVAHDIPARCLVLGNPGRIAQRDYDNQSFL
jgi:serine O-acetyltransferase